MMRLFILIPILILLSYNANAQEDSIQQHTDTASITSLQEVIIISQQSVVNNINKPLAQLDDYLEKTNAVNMINRGVYGREPYLNGMAPDRSVITIDGMRIYPACTDRMDPISSYVEITNLSKAHIYNGASGIMSGATIAGSIDLERKKNTFGIKAYNGYILSGYESNNQQKILGGGFSYTHPKISGDVNITYRDANNYKSGGNNIIPYSQFTKYNTSAIIGYKINTHQQIEASFIYDHAVNIGYPGLTMDVSSAKAFITSLEYTRHHISPVIHQWQTKLFYNSITHIMDDSKRPDVPIRMDMPGWSNTVGFYSLLQGMWKKHDLKVNFSGHHNLSKAEMTMYAASSTEKEMFMLTWPGVHTYYFDISAEDQYPIAKNWTQIIALGMGMHTNQIKDAFGFENMKIFYPNAPQSNTRVLKRISTAIQHKKTKWQYSFGLEYTERAPSVSEGYGIYLFNSFDKFDYIGNPHMKNEKSITFQTSAAYNTDYIKTKLSSIYFYIQDYIIGKWDKALNVMTINATGVKVYDQIAYATIFNIAWDMDYSFTPKWNVSSRISYRNGTGKQVGPLPLIQPLAYTFSLLYHPQSFSLGITTNGACRQNRFNPEFGESSVSPYAIVGIEASQRIKLQRKSLLLKGGIENLLNTRYTTFADWNRIPQMGRNFFLHAIWNF